MIFKLQRPIASNDGNTDVLIYDEHRKYETITPMTPELRKLFGQDVKVFAEGMVIPTHDAFTVAIDCLTKLPDPHW